MLFRIGRIAANPGPGTARTTVPRRDRDVLQASLLLLLSAVTALPGDAVLVEFTSPQCGPCQSMRPVVAQLEQTGVPVRRVDVFRESELAMRYQIRSTPTYVIVAGGKEKSRLVGAQPLAKLQQALSAATVPELSPTHSQQGAGAAQPVAPETQLASVAGGSEAMPSASVAGAIARAEAATVRLRVYDDHGYGVATGTIIDTHGEEALVLTCGHVFRDTEGQGRIEADLFYGGQVKTVSGKVLDFDAGDRDIGLVVIAPGFPVQPVAVLPKDESVRNGQSVYSFGCDRGDDPSRRDTRVTGVNKYNQNIGASNIEIAGAPIDGRSGGGLFDQHGRLIAVCNAADHKGDVGIYTGPGSIYWQLDRVNLSKLYQSQAAPVDQVAAASVSGGLGPKVAPAAQPATIAENPQNQQQGQGMASGGDRQVIVIVREAGEHRMLTFDQPPAELEQLIRR